MHIREWMADMQVKVISRTVEFDALFGGVINPQFARELTTLLECLVGEMNRRDCRVEFVLNDGQRLKLTLLPKKSGRV